MSDSVLFHIHRRSQFRACLIPYHIYINGRFVGIIRNGETLNVDIPKAECYLIEEKFLFSFRSVLVRSGQDVVVIEIKTEGGWNTPTHAAFYLQTAQGLIAPSSAFDFIRAVYDGEQTAAALCGDEKILFLCCEFWTSFSDDGALGEVAAHENVVEMMAALYRIGAVNLAAFCENVFREVLGDVSLPLENVEQYEEQLSDLDDFIRHHEQCAPIGRRFEKLDLFADELRQCAAQFVLRAGADA